MLKRDTMRLSLPQSKIVRGYEVTRAPLGRFLKALDQLSDFPDTLAAKLLPGGDLRAVLTALKGGDEKLLWGLLGRALKVAPAELLGLAATLLDIDVQKLQSDPAIGLDGLAQLVAAWAELNDLPGFFHSAGELVKGWRALAKAGSKGSSRAL